MLRVLTVLACVAIIAAGLLMFEQVRNWVLPHLANGLDVGENPGCVEFALILPGDETGRPLYAAAMVRHGLARDVLILQNPRSADVEDGITLPTAQISNRVLQHRGIRADRIVILESESRTTFDDAQALARFLRGREETQTVAVVTSAFHTRRARFIFRTVFGEAVSRLQFVSAPNPGFAAERWWQTRDGMRLVLTEYLKLGYYYLRHGGLWLWGTVLAVAGMVAGLLIARQKFCGRSRPSKWKPPLALAGSTRIREEGW